MYQSEELFSCEPDLLTRKQAQILLGIGKSTILQLIYDRKLPAYVIANSYRIKKEDLIKFIEMNALGY